MIPSVLCLAAVWGQKRNPDGGGVESDDVFITREKAVQRATIECRSPSSGSSLCTTFEHGSMKGSLTARHDPQLMVQ